MGKTLTMSEPQRPPLTQGTTFRDRRSVTDLTLARPKLFGLGLKVHPVSDAMNNRGKQNPGNDQKQQSGV